MVKECIQSNWFIVYFFVIFCICDLEVYTNKFDGWIVEISFVQCVCDLFILYSQDKKFKKYIYIYTLRDAGATWSRKDVLRDVGQPLCRSK